MMYLLEDMFNTTGWVQEGGICTVFIRIVAAATINFSLAWVRLLIKGGSYSRAVLLILDQYLTVNPQKIVRCSKDDCFMKTAIQIIEI